MKNKTDRETTMEENKEEGQMMTLMRQVALSGLHESTFAVTDRRAIRDSVKDWKSVYGDGFVPVHEAFNCVSPMVLSTLSEEGCDILCRNREEISAVLYDNEIDPSKVAFSNEMLVKSHLKFAAASKVASITFGSLADIRKIAAISEGESIFEVLIAVSPRDENQRHHYHSLLQAASDSGLKISGIALTEYAPEKAEEAIIAAAEVASKAMQMGQEEVLTRLDLGALTTDISESKGVEIREYLRTYFGCYEEMKISGFFGRDNLESCFFTAVRVVRKQKQADGIKTTFTVNDGVFGAFAGCLAQFDGIRPKALTNIGGSLDYSDCDVIGASGDARNDVLGRECQLPDLTVGDWLVFEKVPTFTPGQFDEFSAPEIWSDQDQEFW